MILAASLVFGVNIHVASTAGAGHDEHFAAPAAGAPTVTLVHHPVGDGHFDAAVPAPTIGAQINGAVSHATLPDGRPVAVKRASPAEATREAEILAHLMPHPNVISLVGYFIQGGIYYLILPLATGDLLNHVTTTVAALTPDARAAHGLHIFLQIARDLANMHGNGVAHRDLKPENILLIDGMWALADFGMSVFTTALQFHARYVGTRGYYPPEILNTLPHLAYPSDVFSLAVTVFSVLTGFSPFGTDADAAARLRRALLNSAHRADRSIVRAIFAMYSGVTCHLPPALVNLLDRMLALDPAARPTAPEIVAALDLMMGIIVHPAPPIVVHPSTPPYGGHDPSTPGAPVRPNRRALPAPSPAPAAPPITEMPQAELESGFKEDKKSGHEDPTEWDTVEIEDDDEDGEDDEACVVVKKTRRM